MKPIVFAPVIGKINYIIVQNHIIEIIGGFVIRQNELSNVNF